MTASFDGRIGPGRTHTRNVDPWTPKSCASRGTPFRMTKLRPGWSSLTTASWERSDALPVPQHGFHSAPVVILGRNPGYSAQAVVEEEHDPERRALLLANLMDDQGAPHPGMLPVIADVLGGKWWSNCFKTSDKGTRLFAGIVGRECLGGRISRQPLDVMDVTAGHASFRLVQLPTRRQLLGTWSRRSCAPRAAGLASCRARTERARQADRL